MTCHSIFSQRNIIHPKVRSSHTPLQILKLTSTNLFHFISQSPYFCHRICRLSDGGKVGSAGWCEDSIFGSQVHEYSNSLFSQSNIIHSYWENCCQVLNCCHLPRSVRQKLRANFQTPSINESRQSNHTGLATTIPSTRSKEENKWNDCWDNIGWVMRLLVKCLTIYLGIRENQVDSPQGYF